MNVEDLFKERDLIWVEFTKGVTVAFKILKPFEITAISERCKITSIENGTLISATNDEKFNIEYYVESIKDWKGLQQDGEVFPCTPQNIKKLLDHSEAFNEFVIRQIPLLRKRVDMKYEQEKKT